MPANQPIIFCEISAARKRDIADYVEALQKIAPTIGSHGLSADEFWDSGLLQSAVENIRGTRSATTVDKKAFITAILDHMYANGKIKAWSFRGTGERHDYEIILPDERICVVEAKGCLDGNNTTIYQRPNNADEFIIWSLCQNPGSDPRKNAWSGIHTRLSAEIIHSKEKRVDGVVIWDMLCGTTKRICPKLAADSSRATQVNGYNVPPPCVYLLPRNTPDARNNPRPRSWRLDEVKFLHALIQTFKGDTDDVVEVRIEAQMSGTSVERRTVYARDDQEISQSKWTKLKRAR
jgi:hypothetical protein